MAYKDISDKRMDYLMQWAIDKGLAINETEYLKKIQFPVTNLSNLRNGQAGFTKKQVSLACQLTGASADYIIGFTNVPFRSRKPNTVDILKETILVLQTEIKKRK